MFKNTFFIEYLRVIASANSLSVQKVISYLYLAILEIFCVTFGNPAFCLFLYLTGVHFRGELQNVGDVSEQKIEC